MGETQNKNNLVSGKEVNIFKKIKGNQLKLNSFKSGKNKLVLEYLKKKNPAKEIIKEIPPKIHEPREPKTETITKEEEKEKTPDQAREQASLSVKPSKRIEAEKEEQPKKEDRKDPKRPPGQNVYEKILSDLKDFSEPHLARDLRIKSYNKGSFKTPKSLIRRLKKGRKGLNRLGNILETVKNIEKKILATQELNKNELVKGACDSITKFLLLRARSIIKDKNKEVMRRRVIPHSSNVHNGKAVSYNSDMKEKLGRILNHDDLSGRSTFERRMGANSLKFGEIIGRDGGPPLKLVNYNADNCDISIKHVTNMRNIRKKYKEQMYKLRHSIEDLISKEAELESMQSLNRKLNNICHAKLSKYVGDERSANADSFVKELFELNQ